MDKKTITKKIKEISALLPNRYSDSDLRKVIQICDEIINSCDSMEKDYDLMFANYARIQAYQYLINISTAYNSEAEKDEDVRRMFKSAYEAIAFADSYYTMHYTTEGSLKREMLRVACNSIGWQVFQSVDQLDELEKAIEITQKGAEEVEGSQHYFIYDTLVRLLMKAGRKEEAFEIVGKYPNFEDFEDFKTNEEFQNWLSINKRAELHGYVGETVQEALKRLTEEEGNFDKPIALDTLVETEKKRGAQYPESLRRFCLDVTNSFYYDIALGFGFCGLGNELGLLEHVRCKWYGESLNASDDEVMKWYEKWGFDDEEGMNEVKRLNEHYKVIASYQFCEDCHHLLVLDKNNKMGAVTFMQDYWDRILQIEDSQLKYDSFDELMSRLVSVVKCIDFYDDSNEWSMWNKNAGCLFDQVQPLVVKQ